jgi:regulatory protein
MTVRQDRANDHQAARNAALRLLAVRQRTVTEVRTSLSRRFSHAIADTVVSDLEAAGLLNDASFADAWRESRERTRPRSARLVRHELLQRGIDAAVAGPAVEGMDDEALIEQAAQSYVGRLKGLDSQRFQRRLAGYLLRRGFSSALVGRTLRVQLEKREQLDDIVQTYSS